MKFKTITALCIALALLAASVSAADSISLTVDYDACSVTVAADSLGLANSEIGLVLYESSAVPAKENVSELRQLSVDGSGKLNTTFLYKGKRGLYKAVAVDELGNYLLDKNVYLVNKSDADTMLREFSTAGASDKIITLFDKYVDFFSSELTQADYLLAAQFLASGVKIANLSELGSIAYCGAAVRKFYLSQNGDEAWTALKESLFAIETANKQLADFYSLQSTAIQKQICAQLLTQPSAGIGEFLDKLCNCTVLCSIRLAKNYTQVSAALKSGLVNIPEYNALSYTGEIDSRLVNRSFDSIDSLISEVESIIRAAAPKAPTGGGGGGGGRVSITVPQGYAAEAKESAAADVAELITLSDVKGDDWYYESVMMLAANGHISGYEDGSFCPNNSISREEFTKILVSSLGLLNSQAVADFNDVAADNWSFPYIASAAECGIVKGRENNMFDRESAVKRQDAAVMIYNAAQYKALPLKLNREPAAFDDADAVADYARQAVDTLYCAGIVDGNGSSFSPQNDITRAEAAKLIFAVLKLCS